MLGVAKYKKEACVENYLEAHMALEAGADQIELCSALDLDGLTPAKSDIAASLELGMPIKVMIRSRPGNFVYTKKEGEDMIRLIGECQDMGVTHFVMGMLTRRGDIDLRLLEKCRKRMRPFDTICFHKAIDSSASILAATLDLRNSGLSDSVLTSGGVATALEGVRTIRQMQELCGTEVEIIAAGKITHHNIDHLHTLLRLKTYHGRKIVAF